MAVAVSAAATAGAEDRSHQPLCKESNEYH